MYISPSRGKNVGERPYPCIIDKAQSHIGANGADDHYWTFLSLENFRCANGDVIETIITACAGEEFTLQAIRCNNTDVRLFDGLFAVLIAGCEQLFDVIHDHIYFGTIVKTVERKEVLVKGER